MSMQINSGSRADSPIDIITKGLFAAKNAFGIPVDVASLVKLGHENAALSEQERQQKEQADPESKKSQLAQKETNLALDYASTHGYGDESQISPIRNTILGQNEAGQKVGPGMSASELAKNTEVSPFFALIKGQQAADASRLRLDSLVGVKRDALDESRNEHAVKAGQTFETDKIISSGKKVTNSLDRAISIMTGKEPVTAKTFNIAQQDLINAMAQGGMATEGKVSRELVDTYLGAINEAQQKFGKIKDLRTEQPEIFNNILNLSKQVKGDWQHAMGDQALDLHESFKSNSNPKVQATIKDKLKRYNPQAYAKVYGGEMPQPSPESGGEGGSPFPGSNASAAGGPKTMIKDGHTYVKVSGGWKLQGSE